MSTRITPAPAPAPPAADPTAPRSAVLLAAGVGLAAAAVVPSGPPGVGLVAVAAGAAVLVVRTAGAGLVGWQRVHAAAALLLLLSAALRDAAWLVTLDLLAAAVIGSLALQPARTWSGVTAGCAAVVRTLPDAAAWLTRGVRRSAPRAPSLAPAARGVALTALVLLVFVPLLVSADAAFASRVQGLVPSPPSLESLPARLAVGALAVTAVGAALQLLVWPRPEPVVPGPTRVARRAEWLLPLLALVLLLAGFLAVQGSVLLGGADHVLRTAGVTYASYVHQGFGQLVVVTALVLAVVAAGARWAPPAARPLLGLLCALALVVDASALSRLHLYVEVYGLTRLRISASAIALWLGAVLLLVLLAGLRPGRWLPHATVLSAAGVLLVLTVANPDARIAESGADRQQKADLVYLSSLSDDAVPALDRLPEPQRSCVLARIAQNRSPGSPWTSANLSRARASAVLARRAPGACSGLPG